MAPNRPNEFELIKRFFAPLAKNPGSAGLTDDAAALSPEPGFDLVLTKDVLAAGVHFFEHDAPEAIAAKALRVNLSDLAAKGARPRGYLLGLALHTDWSADWLERFCCGLSADQAAFDVQLLGGDTIRSGNGLQVSITAIGQVPAGRTVRRSGARPGDLLFVSGTIGDAAAGLRCRLDPAFAKRSGLDADCEAHVLDRYLLPRPKVRLAAAIMQHARASMDVSDGLVADCGHIASASNVDCALDLDSVPLSTALHQVRHSSETVFLECINGGDDYEILAAVAPEKEDDFLRAAKAVKCPVSRVGTVRPGGGKVVVTISGEPVDMAKGQGFKHF